MKAEGVKDGEQKEEVEEGTCAALCEREMEGGRVKIWRDRVRGDS